MCLTCLLCFWSVKHLKGNAFDCLEINHLTQINRGGTGRLRSKNASHQTVKQFFKPRQFLHVVTVCLFFLFKARTGFAIRFPGVLSVACFRRLDVNSCTFLSTKIYGKKKTSHWPQPTEARTPYVLCTRAKSLRSKKPYPGLIEVRKGPNF